MIMHFLLSTDGKRITTCSIGVQKSSASYGLCGMASNPAASMSLTVELTPFGRGAHRWSAFWRCVRSHLHSLPRERLSVVNLHVGAGNPPLVDDDLLAGDVIYK